MFEENQNNLTAYIKNSNFTENIFNEVRVLNSRNLKLTIRFQKFITKVE